MAKRVSRRRPLLYVSDPALRSTGQTSGPPLGRSTIATTTGSVGRCGAGRGPARAETRQSEKERRAATATNAKSNNRLEWSERDGSPSDKVGATAFKKRRRATG